MSEEKEAVYRAQVSKLRDDNHHIAVSALLYDIWEEAVKHKPQTIVEIGTGVKGLRTKVLCYVADLFNSDQVSIDVKDCRGCGNDWNRKWRFVKEDGREFVKRWRSYAVERGIKSKIDLLVIDTDELYKTTKEIWEQWNGFLDDRCLVMFRCTNLNQRLVYQNGSSTMKGWDNYRGVVKVVEEIIGPMDEKSEWEEQRGEWNVKHLPWGAGLTILRRGH